MSLSPVTAEDDIVRMTSLIDQSRLLRAGYQKRHAGRLNVFANAFGGFGD
jgi:hypothetical protein